jgi:hypothetical protein
MIVVGILVATDLWTRLLAPVLRAISDFTPAI